MFLHGDSERLKNYTPVSILLEFPLYVFLFETS